MLLTEVPTETVATGDGRRPRLAVVMPAYNEEGLPEFLAELDLHLRGLVSELSFVIVDDTSLLPVSEVLAATTPALRADVTVVRNEANLGHGPSALRAYRGGLDTSADIVLHVDGDGQFVGCDVARLVEALWSSPSAGVVGVRSSRTDPWFRKLLTRGARALVGAGSGPVRDANTPLRAYRREAVETLLDLVEPMATVPHLQFSVLERRTGLNVGELEVTHRVRRGDSEVGTTWQGRTSAVVSLPSRRLVSLSVRAVWELAICLRGSTRCSAAAPVAGPSRDAAAA